MNYVKINGWDCKINKNGKVIGGWNKYGEFKYPYVAGYRGGWDNASGDLTPTQLRGRLNRRTATFY